MSIKIVDLFGKLPDQIFASTEAAHKRRIALNIEHNCHGRFRIVIKE